VPLSRTGADLFFEIFSQRYERGSILIITNLPSDEWTRIFGSERIAVALLDRLTYHVHTLEMNGESYGLRRSGENPASQSPDEPDNKCVAPAPVLPTRGIRQRHMRRGLVVAQMEYNPVTPMVRFGDAIDSNYGKSDEFAAHHQFQHSDAVNYFPQLVHAVAVDDFE
jgi:hypothetical protein